MLEKVISLDTSVLKCFGLFQGVEFGVLVFCFLQSPFLLNC